MPDMRADFGCGLSEFHGHAQHVHPLVNFSPTVAISRLVNSLKGASSRRLRQQFLDLPAAVSGPNDCGPGSTSPALLAAPPTTVRCQHIKQQNRPAELAHVRPSSPPA